MSELSARRALALWKQADLLDPAKAEELARFLEEQPSSLGGVGRLTKVFSTLGAVLVGLGLILFVASNWAASGPLPRGTILFASYGLMVGLAVLSAQRGYETVAGALWFLVTLSLGANIFLALGEHAGEMRQGALEGGLPADRATIVASHEEMAHQIRAEMRPGDLILLKGSRRMGLERVIEGLQE